MQTGKACSAVRWCSPKKTVWPMRAPKSILLRRRFVRLRRFSLGVHGTRKPTSAIDSRASVAKSGHRGGWWLRTCRRRRRRRGGPSCPSAAPRPGPWPRGCRMPTSAPPRAACAHATVRIEARGGIQRCKRLLAVLTCGTPQPAWRWATCHSPVRPSRQHPRTSAA